MNPDGKVHCVKEGGDQGESSVGKASKGYFDYLRFHKYGEGKVLTITQIRRSIQKDIGVRAEKLVGKYQTCVSTEHALR